MTAARPGPRAVPFALLLTACLREQPPSPEVPPLAAEPEVRIGLQVEVPSARLGGGSALLLLDDRGDRIFEIPDSVEVTMVPESGRVGVQIGGITAGPTAVLHAFPRDSGGLIRLGDREYRGRLEVRAGPQGLVVVNRIGFESYLAGVVTSEMGRRAPGEQAALAAQAIVSRTYALRALGKYRDRGFDVLATVADQAYLGVRAERPEGWEAVRSTRGAILTWEREPIEAFFHSTCAGRTAAGEEVYVNGRLPYLRSVPDADPNGLSYCAISPRYRWSEEWSGDGLVEVLRGTLPPLGVAASRISGLRDVAITGHTGSGRVDGVTIRLADATVPVPGSAAVRRVLRPSSGELLRSAAFRLVLSREGERVLRVTAEGRGAGHGVGLCQWGAVGRARAGATVEAILAAYFPGATLERRW